VGVFDQETSFDRRDDRAPPSITVIAQACEACGHPNRSGYAYCTQCGSRTDCTLAYGASIHIEPATERPSAAEIVWDGLARDEDTAVFEATQAGWSLASAEETIVLRTHVDHGGDEGSANEDPADAEGFESHTEVAGDPEAAVLLQLAADGYPGQGTPIAVHLVVRAGWVDVGCACVGPWSDDAWLDAFHVRFTSAPGGLRVWDPGSSGGVWLRVVGGRWLLDGDRFRLGTEFLRYDAAESSACAGLQREGDRGRVQLVVDDEPVGPALPIGDELVLGREAADATFPHDPYVSAHHCRLVGYESAVWLEDLDSSNGTYIRVRTGEIIPFGSVIAMGSALYRVESGEP
jgi:hypothetical protein